MLSYLLRCHSCDLYHLKCFDSTLPKGPVSTRKRDEGCLCLTSPLHCLTTEGINQLSPWRPGCQKLMWNAGNIKWCPWGFYCYSVFPCNWESCSREGYSPLGPQFVYKMKYENSNFSPLRKENKQLVEAALSPIVLFIFQWSLCLLSENRSHQQRCENTLLQIFSRAINL